MKFLLETVQLLKEKLEQLEFDFNKKPTSPSLKEQALKDDSEREFKIIWDRNTYSTMANSREEALGNFAYRLSKGSTKGTGLLRNELKSYRVLDTKWKIKY